MVELRCRSGLVIVCIYIHPLACIHNYVETIILPNSQGSLLSRVPGNIEYRFLVCRMGGTSSSAVPLYIYRMEVGIYVHIYSTLLYITNYLIG